MRITTSFMLLASILLLASCGAKRPVLYTNDYLKQTGPAKADQEIDACMRMADEYKANTDRAKEIAKDTGKTAVVGAATGAVVGAIAGDAGLGAAIGAAGSATG